MSASGLVRVLTHARGDEIDGAVLSDGSIIHFRPAVGAQFSTLLQEGHPLASFRSNGTGLGLAIAREIVEAHGGTICCTQGAIGARFEIQLPWRES